MIRGLNHITLSVSDLKTSFTFYTDVLGCKPLARWRRGCYLLAGDLWLCLSVDHDIRDGPLPEYTHLAFSMDPGDSDRWRERLIRHGVPQWKENTSEGDSLYILDPDGHKLELHAGDWRSRLTAVRAAPYDDMEFFD